MVFFRLFVVVEDTRNVVFRVECIKKPTDEMPVYFLTTEAYIMLGVKLQQKMYESISNVSVELLSLY